MMVGALLQVNDRLADRFFHAIRTALSSFFLPLVFGDNLACFCDDFYVGVSWLA